jgi:hypothetical protein
MRSNIKTKEIQIYLNGKISFCQKESAILVVVVIIIIIIIIIVAPWWTS